VRTVLTLIPLWFTIPLACYGQNVPTARNQDGNHDVSLVQQALRAELAAAQDPSHPMRYRLRRSSPRLSTTKELIETREGLVAMLVAVNDKPLNVSDAAKEKARLDGLLADPERQRHRKQAEDDDTKRVLKVLRVMPDAFVYQHAGTVVTRSGSAERFLFSPKPGFKAPDMETHVLTAMNGEIWIDSVQVRVVRLQARLEQDVDFGWGVLGRLYKGGWITLDQANVGGGVWRLAKFQMFMTARVLIRTREVETTEEETQYAPVPATLDYRQAIEMLRSGQEAAVSSQ